MLLVPETETTKRKRRLLNSFVTTYSLVTTLAYPRTHALTRSHSHSTALSHAHTHHLLYSSSSHALMELLHRLRLGPLLPCVSLLLLCALLLLITVGSRALHARASPRTARTAYALPSSATTLARRNLALISDDHNFTPLPSLRSAALAEKSTAESDRNDHNNNNNNNNNGRDNDNANTNINDYDAELVRRYQAQVVVVGSHWSAHRWGNAQAICTALRVVGEHCALQRALYARDITAEQLAKWIRSDQLSCVHSRFSAWDVPFVGADRWNPLPSPHFERFEHLLAEHPGKIGCALSHVSALRQWLHRLDQADHANRAYPTRAPTASAHYDDTYDSVAVLDRRPFQPQSVPTPASRPASSAPTSSPTRSGGRRRVLLVLEDDVGLHREFSRTLRERLEELEAVVGDDWDVLDVLDRTMFWRPLTPFPLWQPAISQNLTELRWDFSRVTSLVYSERGARRLLAQLPVDTAMDFFMAHLLRNGHLRGFHSAVPLARVQTSSKKIRFHSQIATFDNANHREVDPLLLQQVGIICEPYLHTAVRTARVQRTALLVYAVASLAACALLLGGVLSLRLLWRRGWPRLWLSLVDARLRSDALDHKVV
jgi:GR25 family glycosyltransferase involved in LPS biosynthesis